MTAPARPALVWVAFAITLLIVAIELGSTALVPAPVQRAYPTEDPVGWGIPYLPWIDGIVCYALLLNGLNYVVRDALLIKVQAITTLVLSLLFLLGGIVALLAALAILVVMVMLLLSVPFGTIAYLARWGSFPTGAAAVTLGSLFALKIAWVIVLLIANPAFVRNKMLVLLALTSVLASALTSFLHGFPPGFLVSIADVIAAIVSCVLGLIWTVIFLIGAVIGVVKLVLRTATGAVAAAT